MKVIERLKDACLLLIGGIIILGLVWLLTQHIALASTEPAAAPEVKPPVITEMPTEMTAASAEACITVKPAVIRNHVRLYKPAAIPQEIWEQIWRLKLWEPTPKPEAVDYVALAIEAGYEQDAEYMTKMCYGEDPHGEKRNQAGCYWCVLNRVDDPRWPDTIKGVITAVNQFFGYSPYHPVDPEMYELALDVIGRWLAEKDGTEDVGRVLPREYLYFTGNGIVNTFTTEDVGRGAKWDWSLPNPYEVET